MLDFSELMSFINRAPTSQEAYKIACQAHRDQVDKAGVEYIQHPLTVASQVLPNEKCVIIALLHDVAEDTDITLEELTRIFGQEIGDALALLTHSKSVPYLEYIAAIKANPIARQVKMADLKHNSDLSRLPDVTPQDIERVNKYKKALQILMEP